MWKCKKLFLPLEAMDKYYRDVKTNTLKNCHL